MESISLSLDIDVIDNEYSELEVADVEVNENAIRIRLSQEMPNTDVQEMLEMLYMEQIDTPQALTKVLDGRVDREDQVLEYVRNATPGFKLQLLKELLC